MAPPGEAMFCVPYIKGSTEEEEEKRKLGNTTLSALFSKADKITIQIEKESSSSATPDTDLETVEWETDDSSALRRGIKWSDEAGLELTTVHCLGEELEQATVRIVILLIQRTKFEFLHCEFNNEQWLLVSDVLDQLSHLSTTFRGHRFTSMVRESPPHDEFLNVLNLQHYHLRDGEIVVAVHDGCKPRTSLKHAHTLLKANKKLLRKAVRKARIMGRALQFLECSEQWHLKKVQLPPSTNVRKVVKTKNKKVKAPQSHETARVKSKPKETDKPSPKAEKADDSQAESDQTDGAKPKRAESPEKAPNTRKHKSSEKKQKHKEDKVKEPALTVASESEDSHKDNTSTHQKSSGGAKNKPDVNKEKTSLSKEPQVAPATKPKQSNSKKNVPEEHKDKHKPKDSRGRKPTLEENRPRKAKVDEDFSGGGFLSKKVLDEHRKETEAAAAAKKEAQAKLNHRQLKRGKKQNPSPLEWCRTMASQEAESSDDKAHERMKDDIAANPPVPLLSGSSPLGNGIHHAIDLLSANRVDVSNIEIPTSSHVELARNGIDGEARTTTAHEERRQDESTMANPLPCTESDGVVAISAHNDVDSDACSPDDVHGECVSAVTMNSTDSPPNDSTALEDLQSVRKGILHSLHAYTHLSLRWQRSKQKAE